MTERDEEALWRSIVENYGDRISLESPAEAAAEQAPESGAEASSPAPTSAPTSGQPPVPPPVHRDEPDVLDAWDDPHEHFVPPEPPPLPRLEPPRLLAWAGVFGVPLLVILVSILKITIPTWGSLLGLAWFVGGFGYLVATMRRDQDPDDWDDGAVV